METRDGDYFHPIQLDLKNLAATIALASDALAAAAEALAEAASAIGDATNTCTDSSLPKVSSDITHPVDTPQRLGDRDEPGIENESLGVWPNPADQPDLTGDLSQSRLEYGISNKISSRSVISISSDSSSEVEVVPLDPPLERHILGNESPEHVTDNDSLDSPEPEPEPELNNKRDTLPQSPVALASNEPDIDTNRAIVDGASSSNGPQSRISNLLQSAESYPALPMGRNFIHLEHGSDGFAFIAYMGLQFRKIICLIPDQLMNTCSSLLRSFAYANIFRVHSFSDFRSLSVAFATMTMPNSFNIMLVPPIFMNLLSSSYITPDCVLHWGQPPSSDL
ncbi:unnamed protein product [Rhizoctonia solani]|uniref:Uncharacterized protein n=1 Tax=Rhizoctonia solani TaxID=456999 RepID=A0A8H3DV66_9AGAM|nr:unnamed protein product [Rhizoctonia solani]